MPSVFSHAIAATAIGAIAVGGPTRLTLWGLGAVCAVVPDMDVISLYFGVPYHHVLGHRGLSHSLLFAAVLSSAVTAIVRRTRPTSPSGPRLWTYFFLATASHGLLDAMTNGGLGIAFFAPFSDARYFLPWRPIVVSPISIGEFFGPWGLTVMWSELAWVWFPAALVFLVGLVATSRRLPSKDWSHARRDRS
jgi:inner membrane protein